MTGDGIECCEDTERYSIRRIALASMPSWRCDDRTLRSGVHGGASARPAQRWNPAFSDQRPKRPLPSESPSETIRHRAGRGVAASD